MPRFKCTQTLETHVQVEVDAEDKDEARSKAVQVIIDMDNKEYDSQVLENAEGGEMMVEEIPNEHHLVQLCPECIRPVLSGEHDALRGHILVTEAVCITEVTLEDCDNLNVHEESLFRAKIEDRGTVDLD